MNNFRTEIKLTPSLLKLNHATKLVTLGSCFSSSIGQKLTENKFNCLVNPFGTIFNPISIHKLLEFAAENIHPDTDSYLFNEGVWKNDYFHSIFFGATRTGLEEKIRDSISMVHGFLKTTDYIIITYGTAFIYEKKGTNKIVANCHKQPSGNFTKRLLSIHEIVDSFKITLQALLKMNPAIKVIVTVSPVRHTKDTLELNSVSKSILRMATNQLKEVDIEYFPAYEIVIDDLRDYRFYEADMIHPNQPAIDYIWEKFSDRYFTNQTKDLVKKWKTLRAALNHKPFNTAGEAHQKFLQQLVTNLKELGEVVNTEVEIEQVKSLITTAKF